ncbi:MAG: iron-sulfur cluster assembly accessory protein [Gammaproteobacteria bacterium]|nr:iron-sulfur cluster assembly accessory protein [Gammaproteobacteria bacterium]
MIIITPQAAKQIRISAEKGQSEGMVLRIAANKLDDGSFEYGMGFDVMKDDDIDVKCEGVSIIFAPEYGPMLKGMTIDFVEIENGEYKFIFLNPNDPSFVPPIEDGPAGCSVG